MNEFFEFFEWQPHLKMVSPVGHLILPKNLASSWLSGTKKSPSRIAWSSNRPPDRHWPFVATWRTHRVAGATVLLLYVLCRYTTSRYIQLRCCHLVRLQPSVEPVQFLAACTYCCSTILISKPLLCLPRLSRRRRKKNTKLKPDLLSVTPIF